MITGLYEPNKYVGDGAKKDFDITFAFPEASVVRVTTTVDEVETHLTPGTDFTVSGTKATLTVAPADGVSVTLWMELDFLQQAKFKNTGPFDLTVVEATFDLVVQYCQELREAIDRCVKVGISSNTDPDLIVAQVFQAAMESAASAAASATSASSSLNAQQAAEIARDIAVAAASSLPDLAGHGSKFLQVKPDATGYNLLTALAFLAAIDAEPADTAILKADLPDLLQAIYGDEAQTHTGTDLAALTVNRNHIKWELTADSQFSDDFTLQAGWTGTLVFHVYPARHTLALAASYKMADNLPEVDPLAGEVRIVVEVFNGRKSIIGLQNVEA